jgi:hypothetical protein
VDGYVQAHERTVEKYERRGPIAAHDVRRFRQVNEDWLGSHARLQDLVHRCCWLSMWQQIDVRMHGAWVHPVCM